MTSLLLITTNPRQSIKTHTKADSNHPDTLWIEANPITIDLIRTTHRFAATPPLLHSQKYIVIIDVHCAKVEAQNALLKLLEEPPSYLTLVLTAHSKESMLPTIRSRCHQVYDPSPITKETPDPEITQLISTLAKATSAQNFLVAALIL
jgi:DNA polymerase III subunit delta'